MCTKLSPFWRQGEFTDGMMHGQGTYTWSNKLTYKVISPCLEICQVPPLSFSTHRISQTPTNVFQGQFTQNRVTGKGIYTWPDGSMYDGYVFNGLRHGFGTFVSADGQRSYRGQWQNGKRNGKVGECSDLLVCIAF